MFTMNAFHACLLSSVTCQLVYGQVSIRVPADQRSTVNEGSKLTVECTTSNYDGLVDWLFNGTPISVTSSASDFTKFSVHSLSTGSDVRHYLTVKNATSRDAGLYSCRQIYTASVDIQVQPIQAVQLLSPLDRSVSYEQGDNLTFVCIADNLAVISWYQSGQRLVMTSSNTTRHDDVITTAESDVDHNRQKSQMSRVLVTDKSVGDYQCRDDSGRLNSSTTVSVHVHMFPKSKHTSSATDQFRHQQLSILLATAVILTWLTVA